MRLSLFVKPQEKHEKDLAYKQQLVDQKIQAALKPKKLIEKRLGQGFPSSLLLRLKGP